ncbi:MAG TPA: hypothetical protein PKD53_00470 [Chloroflexaceae bacterium]|nr:hypothetical protein [Chloroflexaceae bacterium]
MEETLRRYRRLQARYAAGDALPGRDHAMTDVELHGLTTAVLRETLDCPVGGDLRALCRRLVREVEA